MRFNVFVVLIEAIEQPAIRGAVVKDVMRTLGEGEKKLKKEDIFLEPSKTEMRAQLSYPISMHQGIMLPCTRADTQSVLSASVLAST